MSENFGVTVTINENTITERANKIIAANAAKHGVDALSFTSEQRDEAKRIALEQLTTEADPHYQAYQQEREKNRVLEAQLETLRNSRPAPKESVSAPFNHQQVRGRLGSAFYTLSASQKIAAAGIDPATVNAKELQKLFGRGSDTAAALDYSRQSPADYTKKREIAKLLDIYGA